MKMPAGVAKISPLIYPRRWRCAPATGDAGRIGGSAPFVLNASPQHCNILGTGDVQADMSVGLILKIPSP